ncbi:MAG: RNA pseudouridine synthase [Bryobacteraceae bacterium]
MPRTDWGWLISAEELRSWIIFEDEGLLVVNKPAHVLCHPSKHGPWSSMVGACRELLTAERLHLVFRLDRETSGVVALARTAQVGSRLQRAVAQRRVRKTYLAILTGRMDESRTVDAPIGPDLDSLFAARQWVVPDSGSQASTTFDPISHANGYTLARVDLHTGRRHQIRVHAAFIGHAILGDKLYGPDQGLMMQFMRDGFTEELRRQLILDRHALHASEIEFDADVLAQQFIAPWPLDVERFCIEVGLKFS